MTLYDELAAMDDIAPFEHPRLVDGQLLLTSREYDAIVEKYGQPQYPTSTVAQITGIPVAVVPNDGTPKFLGNNRVAVCDEALGNIYVFDYHNTIDIPTTWSGA